jgi:hypothetical protein
MILLAGCGAGPGGGDLDVPEPVCGLPGRRSETAPLLSTKCQQILQG